jgi:DNA-binding PadR family transcriptional regulator
MPGGAEDHFRRRLVSLFALTLMEREGPIHGYRISERISERTEGAWRPGPGAIYPTLLNLSKSGYVRSRMNGRRREYSITASGRALLSRIRGGRDQLLRSKPDLGLLWAEVMGAEDFGTFLFLRLRRTLDSIEAQLDRATPSGAPSGSLRDQVVGELERAALRMRKATPRAISPVPGGGR